ncbi:hypothetical protein GGR56DRAFT_25578 [Xylariaceae sp. FL0804]|nr:hypothetical protein GGR56DRAFT_25578 [Xylariaceae sp. FL0804]
MASYLSLVQACDNLSYDLDPAETYYQFFLPGDRFPHGYLLPDVVRRMPWTPAFEVSPQYAPHETRRVVVRDPSGADPAAAVNAALQELVDRCIDRDLFHCIAAQHSEPFAIVSARYGKTVYIERYAAALFGITQRGAHLTAFTWDSNGSMRIWVARRAAHLYTSPGKLDVSVAGGIKAGASPLDTIVAEAGEEASLPAGLVRSRARAAGVLTYVSVTSGGADFPGERGLVIPDMVYTFDIELPADVVPTPRDDEVEGFSLMSVAEVQQRLLAGEFKPDAAMVYIDFFIRHGIITADNEPNYADICMHLHRRLPFKVPGR